MRLTTANITIRVLLYIGIFIVLNLLTYEMFFRLDFTADSRYTLSKSTKDILTQLDQPITITAYFSKNLPPQLATIGTDLKDMLTEYQNRSDNNVVYEFLDPSDDPALEQEVAQSGVAPMGIQVREKDEATSMRGYMGLVIKAGNQQEVIPVIQSTSEMEYLISSNIKKLTAGDKPRVGFVQGHGEPGLNQMAQILPELTKLNDVDTLSFNDLSAWANYKTLVILAPNQQFPPEHLAQLDQFLASGGRLFIGLNTVNGDLQAQGAWDRVHTGLDGWLAGKGVMVEQSFLIDVNCAQVSASQPGSFFSQLVRLYHLPIIRTFSEHLITQGLEEILLPFGSPITITITNSDSSVRAGVLATTSEQSGKQPPPVYYNPNHPWSQADFAYGNQNVAVWLEGKFGGENESKMIVVGDGDFPLPVFGQPAPANNINFLVNSIDWLTDDTGLIGLRTKSVSSRPIEKQLEDGERNLVKWVNFLAPILIVVIFGIVRSQRRRNRRLRWMAEDYS